MAKNSYLTQYVHGCRRFRKFGDYWLSQFKVHPSKEKMDVACEHYAKRYPDAIVKVFKVRCHGRSWVYGIYWIHPEQMKQQDKERKDAESQATCQYCEIRDFENCMFNRQPFQSHWLSGCVESEMGNCYMCDKPAVFIAHDLPTGEKQFCSELHYCQYAGAPYHGEGYYGFTDPAKVKEPARLARARKRLKYAETFEAPRNCALCGVSGHNRRTCPTKGINPFSNGDTIICKKDSGGRHKVFIVDDLAKYTESPNGEIILEHPNGLKSGFDDIDDVKYFFEVYDPTDEKYEVGFYPMLMNGRIKEYKKRFGSIQPSKQHYIPKYKVGDILNLKTHPNGLDRIEIIELQHHGKNKDFYHCKYLDGVAKWLFVDIHFEELDSNKNYELYFPPKTNPRIARLKKRFGFGVETFSAEKVKKEILKDDWQGLEMKFIYKDREGKLEWSDNEDGKGGVLSFGDSPFKKGERMSRLPHTHTIDSATSKLAAKEMFRIMLDKPCESCGDAIHNKDIGACGWCEDDWDKKYKFDPKIDLENDKWWKNLSDRLKDLYNDDLTTKNPYCRDCLYYYGAFGETYPNKFDREGGNYYLMNAVCETHWAEIVAEGGLSKDSKRHSLYEIENVSPRERMMKQRFGLGAETFEADTNQWKVGDKVKILNNGGGVGFNIGEIVTITMVDYGGTYLSVNGNGAEWTISKSNGILVGEEKKYIPKYKVGDILIDRETRDKAIIVDYTSAKGEYHWKYLEGGFEGIFLDTPFEELDTDIDYELYVPPTTNPRIARLKKRFGLGAENEYVKTGVASLVVVSLLGFALFKRN